MNDDLRNYDDRVRVVAELAFDSARTPQDWMRTFRINASYWVEKGAIEDENQYLLDVLKILETKVNG